MDVFIRASLMYIDATQTSCLYALFHRVYYIHIQRGLSCCSVQQYRAMRRPPDVERAALKVPRFVFIVVDAMDLLMTDSGTIGQFLFFQIWKKTIKTNFSQEESSSRIPLKRYFLYWVRWCCQIQSFMQPPEMKHHVLVWEIVSVLVQVIVM